MHRVLTEPLDRLSIRLAARAVHRGIQRNTLEAAKALIHSPDFFAGFATEPADFRWTGRRTWEFSSLIRTPWPCNNIVPGRFYPATRAWPALPTVLLLHGWNAEWSYRSLFPLLARQLNAVGLNAVMFTLPYHGQRKPRIRGAPRNFLSNDLAHVAQAAQQALADARCVIGWLVASGCRRIGVWGISLGGWLAGLLVCHEPRLHAAVLLTPVARLDRVIKELEFCAPLRQQLAGRGVRLDPLNLISHKPLLPPSQILIVASEHDLFAPIDSLEELWQIWSEPVLWRPPHGHISALMAAPLLMRAARWLAHRLST